MNTFRIFPALALLVCIIFTSNASATIDSNAAIVQVQDPANGNCMEAGAPLNNCFTDSISLTNWIAARNPQPSSTAPLLVKFGPGHFGGLICGNSGGADVTNITFQGSGRGQTKIDTVTIQLCTNVLFSNMTIGSYARGNTYGIVVFNSGKTTTWTNVEVIGPDPWYEYSCTGVVGKHTWFGSTISSIKAGDVSVYNTHCDQSWFYGSEIIAQSTGGTLSNGITAINAVGGEVHVYGSVIRSLNTGTAVTTANLHTAVYASGAGTMVHIHGTGIDLSSSTASAIVALNAENGAMIHANDTAYNMQSGTGGTVTRILNNGGHIHAPYLWEHIPDPTAIPNFTSVTGADMTNVTTSTSDGHPHFVIYDSTCASKWYDTVDKACRP